MKIIQITDLHIGKEGEATRGIDVRQNFLDILEGIKTLKADHLVLTGDLCFQNGDSEIYSWIKNLVDDLNIPYDVISGNHDDSQLLAKVFQKENLLQEETLFFKKKLGGATCFFLDTASAIVSPEQMDWLKLELRNETAPLIIFMHHPPVHSNVTHLDKKYPLKNRKEFQEILVNSGLPITVFCGHYHVEKTIHFKNIVTHITPSCYVQVDWRAEIFKIDHNRIALREIEITDTAILSSVSYFEGNRN